MVEVCKIPKPELFSYLLRYLTYTQNQLYGEPGLT